MSVQENEDLRDDQSRKLSCLLDKKDNTFVKNWQDKELLVRSSTWWRSKQGLFVQIYWPRWRRKWHPTPVFMPGESHGQKCLTGYSPWGLRLRYDWNESARTHWPQIPCFWWSGCLPSSWHREGTFHMGVASPAFRKKRRVKVPFLYLLFPKCL